MIGGEDEGGGGGLSEITTWKEQNVMMDGSEQV